MSFTGGKLKLKGGQSLGGVDKKKKKKRKAPAEDDTAQQSEGQELALSAAQGSAEVPDGQYLPEPSEAEDRRTPAERRYDEMMAKRAAEKTKKMAMKSHRERIAEYNEHLSNLSEHHDIPKVGPG
eukprot:jgi/Astpho2/3545/Aster-x0167